MDTIHNTIDINFHVTMLVESNDLLALPQTTVAIRHQNLDHAAFSSLDQ